MTNIPKPTYPAPDKRRRPPQARVAFAPAAAAAAVASDPVIAALVAQVDPARLADSVKSLALIPTRHSLSPHNVEAAKWLRDRFLALGYAAVSLQDFMLGDLTRHNVVCTKMGGPSRPSSF